mmetsp:Transcript_109596/g.244713  ORF Transcript_109596/g.244713 Transcript_109596/m.244713 type:complete len:483 (+) Transcript_109596:74-1522(+)
MDAVGRQTHSGRAVDPGRAHRRALLKAALQKKVEPEPADGEQLSSQGLAKAVSKQKLPPEPGSPPLRKSSAQTEFKTPPRASAKELETPPRPEKAKGGKQHGQRQKVLEGVDGLLSLLSAAGLERYWQQACAVLNDWGAVGIDEVITDPEVLEEFQDHLSLDIPERIAISKVAALRAAAKNSREAAPPPAQQQEQEQPEQTPSVTVTPIKSRSRWQELVATPEAPQRMQEQPEQPPVAIITPTKSRPRWQELVATPEAPQRKQEQPEQPPLATVTPTKSSPMLQEVVATTEAASTAEAESVESCNKTLEDILAEVDEALADSEEKPDATSVVSMPDQEKRKQQLREAAECAASCSKANASKKRCKRVAVLSDSMYDVRIVPLETILRFVRPDWTALELQAVQDKFAKLGILTAEELLDYFTRLGIKQFNQRLKSFGEKPMKIETLDALHSAMFKPKHERAAVADGANARGTSIGHTWQYGNG